MQSGMCGKNLTWTLDDKGTLTISGTGEMDNYSLYDNMTSWYDNLIKNVIIKKGVTSIGSRAFFNCTSLMTIKR